MPGALVVDSQNITLRTVEEEDIGFIQRAYTNPELRLPLGWDVSSRDELEREIDDNFGHDEVFLICLDDGVPGQPAEETVNRIGCVVAGTSERARSGIGFWLVPEFHAKGYGREAVILLVEYLFNKYPHPAITAKTLPTNEASRGLLESLGFSEEGRLRKEAFWDGEYRDTIVYGLLRKEWVETT